MLRVMDSLELSLNTAVQRYEAKLEGSVVAFIEYRDDSSARSLTHTKVNDNLEGQGISSQLVKFALEEIKSSGSSLVPMCPFVAASTRSWSHQRTERCNSSMKKGRHSSAAPTVSSSVRC